MNKIEHLLAKRYAQAFLNVFYDCLKKEHISSFEQVSDYFKDKKQVCFLLDLSLLSLDIKQDAIKKIIKDFQLPYACLSLCNLIIADKRSLLLSAIFYDIADCYKKRLHLITMQVESAIELSIDQKNDIALFLKEQLQTEPVCTFVVNKELIAGIKIANENYIWQRSVSAQLKALKNSGRH